MIGRKRLLRNIADSRDANTIYLAKRFGTAPEYDHIERKHPNPTKPSELFQYMLGHQNAATLLDPYYQVVQLQTLYKLASDQKICKKDFTPDQVIFTPQILVYMIFMSEDHTLRQYLRCWRKFVNVPLTIAEDLITKNLVSGCSCQGCFGECIRIADRYGLLPKVLHHDEMTQKRQNNESK